MAIARMVPAVCAFTLGIALREYAALSAPLVWTIAALSLIAFPVARVVQRPKLALLPLGLLVLAIAPVARGTDFTALDAAMERKIRMPEPADEEIPTFLALGRRITEEAKDAPSIYEKQSAG